jgi:hypothetical protein
MVATKQVEIRFKTFNSILKSLGRMESLELQAIILELSNKLVHSQERSTLGSQVASLPSSAPPLSVASPFVTPSQDAHPFWLQTVPQHGRSCFQCHCYLLAEPQRALLRRRWMEAVETAH